jgi:hypothetical protein
LLFDKISFSPKFQHEPPEGAMHFVFRRHLSVDDLRNVMLHEPHRFPRLAALEKHMPSITVERREATVRFLRVLRVLYAAANRRVSRADSKRDAAWLIGDATSRGSLTTEEGEKLLRDFATAFGVLASSVYRYGCQVIKAAVKLCAADPAKIPIADLLPSGPQDGIITRGVLFGSSEENDFARQRDSRQRRHACSRERSADVASERRVSRAWHTGPVLCAFVSRRPGDHHALCAGGTCARCCSSHRGFPPRNSRPCDSAGEHCQRRPYDW